MELQKKTVLDFIKERGDKGRLAQAEDTLPEQVDTERDAVLLAQLGVEPEDLDERPGPHP